LFSNINKEETYLDFEEPLKRKIANQAEFKRYLIEHMGEVVHTKGLYFGKRVLIPHNYP
jgi:hypothetical protein